MDTQYIRLNMIPTGIAPSFYISQYDVGRELGVYVYVGSKAFDLTNYTCTIEATRRDGVAITTAVTTSVATTNKGTFEVTATMSNIADRYLCQLVITNSQGKRIASLPFIMNVVKAAMDENAQEIEEDASLYQQYTIAVQKLIADVRENIEYDKTGIQNLFLQVFSQLGNETNARTQADATINARINNIISPSGEAPNAAEITDARVGANGTIYNNLGTAIRTQVDNLESDIKATAENNVFYASKATKGQRLTISGELTALAAYFTSDYIPVTPNIPYFLNFTLNDMVRVCTYDVQKTFIAYFNNRQNPIVFDSDVAYIRICDVIENIDSDTVIEWKGYTKSVTPEMFGAVGDGVVDDTTKLNNAIAYARQNNKILSAVSGKVYAISSQIDLSDVDVDFNNATIKAIATIQHMITIDSRTRVNYEKPNTIQNMILDCNNTSGGFDYIFGSHETTDNVNILNCHQTAYYIRSGGGVKVLNAYIMGDASETSCGIVITTSDCHFQQLIIKDCHLAMVNSGTNLYLLVHSWLSKNCSDTVCFTHNSGNPVLVQCHFDTYQKAIFRKTDKNIDLIGCIYYINTNLWDSEQTPCIVWANDNTFAYSANIHFQNCSFDPLRSEVQLTNISYNRIVFDNCFFKDGIVGNVNNVDMILSRVSANENYNYVHLRQEGKYIKLNALVTPTEEFTTGYCIIARIPPTQMYPDGYTFRGLATIGLDALTPSETLTVGLAINPTSGAITINTPTTLDVSRVKFISIDISYKAKQSLDYYRG